MNTILKSISKRRVCALLTALMLIAISSLPALSQAVDTQLIVGIVAAAGADINPYTCIERDYISLNQLVFESVVELNDLMKPTPELCDTWTVENGVWTFTLRPNVRFHDGTYLSAVDVVESWNRIMAIGENSPYYIRCSYITAMEAADLYTVKVTSRFGGFLTLYAMTFPVAQRGTLTWPMACGTGPYWYMYNDANWIQIDVNPYWWKVASPVDTIFGYRYDETGDALQALQTGEIEAFSTRSLSASFHRKLSDRTSIDYTTLTYEMLTPNFASPLFSNASVRGALMYAIDRSSIATNVYQDMVTESEVPVVPGTWIYETQSAVYNYSPERALQLMYQAGWGDYDGDGVLDKVIDGVLVPFEFTLITYVDDTAATRTHAANTIADQLAVIGIKVNVKTQTKSAVSKALGKGEFDMALCAVNMSSLPDLTFLLAADGKMNHSGYSSGDMAQLLSQARTVSTEDEFRYIFSQIQLKVVNDLPMLGLFFRKGVFMTTAGISGMQGVRELDTLRGIEKATLN